MSKFANDNHGDKALGEGKALEGKHDEWLVKTDMGQTLPGQKDTEHPGMGGRYFPATPDPSARILEKKAWLGNVLQDKGFRAQITDADAKRIIRQEQRLAEAEYENWLAKFFVKGIENPSDAAWAQRTFPSYFEKRKKVIEDWTEMQKRIAIMKLIGPQNEDDLKLLYMHTAGLIKVPKEAVHLATRRDINEKDVVRGMFNPRRTAYKTSEMGDIDVLGNPKEQLLKLGEETGPYYGLDLDNPSWFSHKTRIEPTKDQLKI